MRTDRREKTAAALRACLGSNELSSDCNRRTVKHARTWEPKKMEASRFEFRLAVAGASAACLNARSGSDRAACVE